MPMRKWFEKLLAPTNRRARRAATAHRARPQVEEMEGRVVPAAFTELEPNDTAATANLVSLPTGDVLTTAPSDWLEISGTVTGAMGAPSRVDFYQFSITTRAGVFFDVDARDTNLMGNLDATLTLFDAAGVTQLAANDNGYDFDTFVTPNVSTFNGTSLDSSLYADLPPGTYIVMLTGSGTTTGDYRLRMLADTNYSTAAPAFSSLPASGDTLFLDFNGHIGADAFGSYNAKSFDLTGNPSEFSPGERLAIRNIWSVTAEDYRPFNLNVTTVEPTAIGAFNDAVGFRHVITSSAATDIDPMSTPTTLGVAITNGYAGGGVNDNIGFTFATNFTGNYAGGISGAIVAEALEVGNTTSHEFGHALGLNHYASNAAAAMAGGAAPGANVLPNAIMATPDIGLNRELFFGGNNTASLGMGMGTTTQDDLVVVRGGTNTLGLRADDVGNTRTNATALGQQQPAVYLTTGVITDNGDVDFFRFIASGTTTVTVDVDDYIGNLNAQVQLFDANGNSLATDNPGGNVFDAAIPPRDLPMGTYFVAVRNSGAAGEIGQYSLRISTGVNLLPVVSASAGAAAYLVNNPPVAIDPGLTLTDLDSTVLTGARVQIVTGYVPGQDVLALPDGSGLLSFFDATTGTLTLFGSAPLSTYQAALRTVTYASTGATPATSVRTISFRGVDDNGPGAASTRALIVGNAPVVGVSFGTTAFAEGGAPTVVDPLVNVADADSTTLTGATAQITIGYAMGQDTLSFTPGGGITGAFNAATGTLTLSGSATVAAYQAALRSVTYNNSSTNPAARVARVISFSATDGISTGPTVTKTLAVLPNNGAPVNTVPAGPLTTAENAPLALTGISVTDADSTTMQVTLTVTRGTLTVNTGASNGLTAAQVSGNGTANVVLVGTQAAINATLAAAPQYTPTANLNGADTLAVVTSDLGGSGSVGNPVLTATSTVAINVTAVNAAPVATADALSAVPVGSGVRVIPFSALLGNDNAGPNETDQTLTVTAVGGAVGGTVAIVNGAVEFTPAAGFGGNATFTYTITDNGQTNGTADPKAATATASFLVGTPVVPPVVPPAPPTATNATVSGGAVVVSKANGTSTTIPFAGSGLTPTSAFTVSDFNGGGGSDVAVEVVTPDGRRITLILDGVTDAVYAAIGDLNGDGVTGDVALQVPSFSALQGAPAGAVFLFNARTGQLTRIS